MGQASWLAVPGRLRLRPSSLEPLAGQLTAAAARLRADQSLGGLQAATSIPAALTGLARSYAVARSLLAVSGLQLLLVAMVALAFAARLLAGQREEETALLAARGAARGQLSALALAEALALAALAVAAGMLAGSWLARLLTGTAVPGLRRPGKPEHGRGLGGSSRRAAGRRGRAGLAGPAARQRRRGAGPPGPAGRAGGRRPGRR